MIVILRSRSDGSVRLAITLGTEHPNPINIGTILLPDKAIFLSSLSLTKATRAIYPVSSNNDKKKNKITIIGKKLIIEPTPWNTPSITSE